MSVQFGRWNSDGGPSQPGYLEKVSALLAPYGPDGRSVYSKGGMDILYYAFHTTKESCEEIQPHILRSGNVLTWDGRLDNRAEFVALLKNSLPQDSADVSIVAAAYDRWGTECFARLIGDWALSVWDPKERSLVLAKDPIGTHHLYYAVGPDGISWSTVLDPLVLLAEKTLALDQEYIAGWLGMFPAAHLSPFRGIHSVPPSSFVLFQSGKQSISKYWDFDPRKRIRYTSDGEYEEHFRTVFAESVRRRLRSDSPILAELSGGIDSSSIVCMADTLIAEGSAGPPRLDTVSYYDESEPNWDERPYYRKVEEQRGRTGLHIDVSGLDPFPPIPPIRSLAFTPGSLRNPTLASREFAETFATQGNRVLLSGVGGDEVTGGVPNPTPEFADLLATCQCGALARKLKVWALQKRKPWFYLIFDTFQAFLPPALQSVPKHLRGASWLDAGFARRNQEALAGYRARLKWFGSLPSFQGDLSSLILLRRQLSCHPLACDLLCEKRYPYLDRDFLEFLFAVPRDQILRPGQRRSLMRRALAGFVPDEVLNRKRKAFVTRSPMRNLPVTWERVIRETPEILLGALGIVDEEKFRSAIEETRRGGRVALVPLVRAVGLEMWLRNLTDERILPHAQEKPTRRAKEISPHQFEGPISQLR